MAATPCREQPRSAAEPDPCYTNFCSITFLGMEDLESLKCELERERRSLAMLPPTSPITREKAIALIRRCQAAIAAAQHQND